MNMSSDTCYHSTTVNTFLHGTDRVRSVLYLCVTLDVRKIITFSVRVGLVGVRTDVTSSQHMHYYPRSLIVDTL